MRVLVKSGQGNLLRFICYTPKPEDPYRQTPGIYHRQSTLGGKVVLADHSAKSFLRTGRLEG